MTDSLQIVTEKKQTIKYIECHLHSCGSQKDAHGRIDKIVAKAKELGQPAVALTDHGALHMIPSFFAECAKQDIKPLAGMEGYFTDVRGGDDKTTTNYHQLYIVKNLQGWKNLMKLSSEAFATGFHNRPRADWELLEKHHEGLIATSSCLAGMIPQAILKGELREARKLTKRFVDIFGEDFYLEIQPTPQDEQYIVNKELIKISHELGVKLLATGDVHYVEQDDMIGHQGMLCMGWGKKMLAEDTPEYPCEEYYFMKTAKEMYQLFARNGLQKEDIISALASTVEVADKVDFTLMKHENLLPEFPVPEGTTVDKKLAESVKEGLMRKVFPVTKTYVERIKFELSVIREKGFQDYFMIKSDALKFCRENHIMTAPARGSAGGSLVAYLLDITEVDPIPHGLYFERFLDITRLKFPDIDTDIEDVRRYELIKYLRNKYGADKVAQIVNMVYMNAKTAYKNALTIYDIPFGDSQKITNMIPDGVTLEEAYEQIPELRRLRTSKRKLKRKTKDAKKYKHIQDWVYECDIARMAEKFEGVFSHFGKHAGGVLITPTPITDYFPTFVPDASQPENVVTQWHKDEIEQYGGIKFDFLGLKTLRVIGLTLESIYKETGERPDILHIAKMANDPEVYAKISRGETANAFQFASAGMQQLCKAVQPTKFEHLVAINALYRPPALASGDTWRYADIKNGKAEEHYSHPDERAITGETFGVITYQEHVMEIVHTFAGWDYGRGDKLRKSSADELEAMRSEFLTDCFNNDKLTTIENFTASMSEMWDRIVRYMGYGFNKSHGVAYTMITYMTMWLEHHFPEHFQASLMSTKMADKDKIAQIFQDVRRAGFDFQTPDINKSGLIFTAHSKRLVFPLTLIKGVGEGAVEEILRVREDGKFASLDEFLHRINKRMCNAKAIKPLIYAGAFDEMYEGWTRNEILVEYMTLKGETKKKIAEQVEAEWNDDIKAEHEKDLLGIYLSCHPLEKFHFKNWQEFSENYKEALIGGAVSKVKTTNDRNGKQMAFVSVDTIQGVREVVCFAGVWKKYSHLIVPKSHLMFSGTKQGEKMLLNKVKELS
ncbi:DNA polymerase III alpha subunit [Bacillus phage Anath]|uniref:DNA-directed DNA polymerase n=1 Tax=Bacillus phage Anath TaxID=2108114 RepID=A0A2P1JUL8_9CAUD|nr:DNA polymerase III alpha subunit [Bacillus phage Anath]